jgi:ankyrin repeat protein
MQDLFQRSQSLPSTATLVGSWWSSSTPPPSTTLFHHSFPIPSTGLTPTKVLNESIRRRDWDATRVRVLSHPWDASYRAKQRNNATPLHLACLYRAPIDVVRMVFEANPKALLCQDSEGWTPLHVILLYGDDEETALMLIRQGGAKAAAVQSRVVGAPLHLAFRHGCSTAIIKELLRVNPAMATTANEYSTKPAKILWYHYSRNPDNERMLNDIAEHQLLPPQGEKSLRELVERLTLLVRAAKGQQHWNKQQNQQHCQILHDVVMATEKNLGDLSLFLPLIVLLYPEQLRMKDGSGNLPLHNAASYPPTTMAFAPSFRRHTRHTAVTITKDPVEVLVQGYPVAATIPNSSGHLPLHIALSRGQRRWRTGISSILLAAPEVLLMLDLETQLLPFQLAAAGNSHSDAEQEGKEEVVETILELLLACPHAIPRTPQ